MNALTSILRISTLELLMVVATILLLSEEQDADFISWLCHLLTDKIIGLQALLLVYYLYERWRKTDPWIAAYHKWCLRGLIQ